MTSTCGQGLRVGWDGPRDRNVFLQNAVREQRGLADPNLSLVAWRASASSTGCSGCGQRAARVVHRLGGQARHRPDEPGMTAVPAAEADGHTGAPGSVRTHVDIAVLGAGIIGCLIAREVARRAPGASVLLLDRDQVGWGATAARPACTPRAAPPRRVRAMTRFSQAITPSCAAITRQCRSGRRPCSWSARRRTSRGCVRAYLPEAELTATGGVPSEVRLPDGAVAWSAHGGHYADVAGVARAWPPNCGRRRRARGGRGERDGRHAGRCAPRLSTGTEVTAGRVVLAPGPWLAAPAWRTCWPP